MSRYLQRKFRHAFGCSLRAVRAKGSIAAVSIWLGMHGAAVAGPIAYGFGENALGFAFNATHGAINGDAIHRSAFGVLWLVKATIVEDAGFLLDSVSIDGTAQHMVAPHAGEAAPNPGIFPFSFFVNGLAASGSATIVVPDPDHPAGAHGDDYWARLTFQTNGAGAILGYQLEVVGVHCLLPGPPPPPPPRVQFQAANDDTCSLPPDPERVAEPGSAALVAAGLGLVASALRRRRIGAAPLRQQPAAPHA